MNYFQFKQLIMRLVIIFLAALTLSVSSCSKDNNSQELSQETMVRINLSGVSNATENNNTIGAKSSIKSGSASSAKTTIIPFDDEHSIVATVKSSQGSAQSTMAKATIGTTKAAATPDVKQLTPGTQYTVAVYTTGGVYVAHKSFTYTVGQKPELPLAAGNYIFVVVASGSNTLPEINFNQTLSAINWTVANASMDVMYFNSPMEVKANQTNTLNVVLQHKFSEVEVTVDTKAVGTATVANGTVSVNYSNANFTLANGTVNYTGATSAPAAITFPTTTGTLIASATTLLLTKGDAGTISIPVTINGTTKPVPYNLTLAEGVRYEITLLLQRKGLSIGGGVFSPGDLVYDRSTGEYGFAPSNGTLGDYFYGNYVQPKKINVGNTNPNSADNGALGDPCDLVYPLHEWRLPTEAEANALINSVTPGNNGGNWTNPWQNNTYVERFNGAATDLGQFIGTQSYPGANRENYLFIGFGGYYVNTDDISGTKGSQGRYLIKTPTGYTSLQVGGGQGTYGYIQITPLETNAAVQIRCVKAKP